MKTIVVVTLNCLFFLPSICFSNIIASINVGTSYSGGAVTIPKPQSINNDTVLFSNDIVLSFFDQFSGIPEDQLLYHGEALDSNAALVKAGFKCLQTATWQIIGASGGYYATDDTVWSASLAFPDTLMHLDSLFGSFLRRESKGKWLFYTYPNPYPFIGFSSESAEGYNNIFYIHSTVNKMKLQFSHVYINFYDPIPGGTTRVDSIRLLWAVDSLGNGIFRPTSAIKGDFPPSPKTGKQYFNSGNIKTIRDLINSGRRVELYNPAGKLVGCMDGKKAPDALRLPPGILLYKMNVPDQPSVWGKLLVR